MLHETCDGAIYKVWYCLVCQVALCKSVNISGCAPVKDTLCIKTRLPPSELANDRHLPIILLPVFMKKRYLSLHTHWSSCSQEVKGDYSFTVYPNCVPDLSNSQLFHTEPTQRICKPPDLSIKDWKQDTTLTIGNLKLISVGDRRSRIFQKGGSNLFSHFRKMNSFYGAAQIVKNVT